MINRLYTRIFYWFIFLPLGLYAQQSHPYFQSYTIEDGLGGEAINDVLVDRFGYVWTAAYSGLHRYDGYEFVNYPADILDSCSLSHQIVHKLLEDNEGGLWVGTSGGLNRLDRASGCFQRFFHDAGDSTSLPGNEIIDLCQSPDGSLAVLTKTGAAIFQPATKTFRRLSAASSEWDHLLVFRDTLWAVGPAGMLPALLEQYDPIPFSNSQAIKVSASVTQGDSIVFATNQGIYLWHAGDRMLRNAFPLRHQIMEVPITDILPAQMHGFHGFWITTHGDGFGWMGIGDDNFGIYDTGKPFNYSLLDNHTRCLAYDKLGALWIGSYVGLNRFNLDAAQPRYYRSDDEEGLGDQVIELHVTPDGRIIYNIRWRGVLMSPRIGTKQDLPLRFPQNDYRAGKDLSHMYTDRQGITWLLRSKDKIYHLTADQPHPVPFLLAEDLSERQINWISQDPQHDDLFWLATDRGLARLHRPSRTLDWWKPSLNAPQLTGDAIATLLPDRDGRIWLSAGNYYNDHLGYFDPATQEFSFLIYEPGNPEKIGGGRVKQLVQGPEGIIWAATSQGLLSVDPTTNDARLLTQLNGTRVGVPEAIITDTNGNVWFTSGDQIGCYLPNEDRIQKTTCPPVGQFTNATSASLPDGRLLFGGQYGMVTIQPSNVNGQEKRFPEIVFNSILVNGFPYKSDQQVAKLTNLSLGASQRTLTLRFAGLFFDRNQHIKYAYRLNGSSWQALGRERSLSFADLNPGSYQLEIRASDGQGNWNPTPHRVTITVASFWYETTTAWAIGALATITLLFLLGRLLVRRKLERQKLQQLQEVDAFKSRFLTNFTHEFRTPLTLILGPARRLREQARSKQDATLEREARRIDRQGNRLLELINQLLDLRKLEAGQLAIVRTPADLSKLLTGFVESFQLKAAEKKITLNILYQGADAGAVEVDNSKVESIVTNLIANALKYTPAGGAVDLSLVVQDNTWSLTVQDSGPGIPPEQRERIFARFARAPGETATGTGIGLALARELAQLLGGSLTLQDNDQPGACFLLQLPLHPANAPLPAGDSVPNPAPLTSPAPAPAAKNPAEDAPLVLIVEDDPDVRAYLAESLATTYRVLTAPDGQAGLTLAFQEIPDLVVSDVMMPNLNGLQLCARLKSDRRTNHLPVLLLTAKTATEHRLEGLDQGADAYLSKPFSERELHLRLRNLLTLRDNTATQLRAQLLATGTQAPAERQAPPTAASPFLQEARQLILSRLDDPTLAVGDLEKGLGLSRSQLHRKLTATLGLSASKLINQLRLEAAANKLQQTSDPVSNIAYDCGFRDVGYFGKRFRERYGESPSGFRAGVVK